MTETTHTSNLCQTSTFSIEPINVGLLWLGDATPPIANVWVPGTSSERRASQWLTSCVFFCEEIRCCKGVLTRIRHFACYCDLSLEDCSTTARNPPPNTHSNFPDQVAYTASKFKIIAWKVVCCSEGSWEPHNLERRTFPRTSVSKCLCSINLLELL